LFADESEALAHPYLAHARAARGADLRVAAPGQAKKVALIGALDAATPRAVVVRTSRTKRSTDFIALLDEIDRRYGPRPGRPTKPVVPVLDDGPIHTSKLTTRALAARPWLTVEWLPRYAPELNPIEPVGRDLKRHHLAHRTFLDADHLERAIHEAVEERNRGRAHPCDNLRTVA
jgi:transposase